MRTTRITRRSRQFDVRQWPPPVQTCARRIGTSRAAPMPGRFLDNRWRRSVERRHDAKPHETVYSRRGLVSRKLVLTRQIEMRRPLCSGFCVLRSLALLTRAATVELCVAFLLDVIHCDCAPSRSWPFIGPRSSPRRGGSRLTLRTRRVMVVANLHSPAARRCILHYTRTQTGSPQAKGRRWRFLCDADHVRWCRRALDRRTRLEYPDIMPDDHLTSPDPSRSPYAQLDDDELLVAYERVGIHPDAPELPALRAELQHRRLLE